MKILHIINSVSDEYGGPTVGVKSLARALASRGNSVSVYGTKSNIKKIQEVSAPNYRLYEFPLQKPHKYYYTPQLGKFFKKTVKDYDIVHIHGIWTYPVFIASRVCRFYNIPYIIRTCGMLDLWSISQKKKKKILYFHLIEKQNLKNASFIQFSTEVEFQKSFYRKWDRRKLRYIPNIVDLEDIEKSNSKLDERLTGKKYILFFGRLCHKKGLDILIKAFDFLQKNPAYKDIYLVLMGPDNDGYLGILKKELAHLNIWDKVINLGMTYGNDRFSVVKNAIFLCLPSRQENLGLSIIESLACGIPVIIAGSVDIAHFIESENVGKISNIDSTHLCAIIKEMLDSERERIKMGENGKRFVYNRFNKDVILDKYMNMYDEAINRNIKKC